MTLSHKRYLGYRLVGGALVQVWQGNHTKDLAPRCDLRDHSPTGLEWGYHGSGPSQLALALLADATGDDAYACDRYQDFKRDIVANWSPQRGWAITQAQILEWVATHPVEER